ncbi:hypothetical protein LCGC14_1731210 [marine sediment metagenome]|uniref:Uncharacterized protein n=1 Tax=marine sediment metagenome TaxID=412755 RepID=A0A0F9K974_9ZZZZ
MSITLVRVTNEQTLPQGISRDGSILLDKIDKSQGNSDSPPYAQLEKQKIYVPFVNPLDTAVNGYTDLVRTDEVILASAADGSIGGLANTTPPRVSVVAFDSALIATPVVSNSTNGAGTTTVTGTTLLSVAPDRTRLILSNPAGASQTIEEADFASHTGTTITFVDAKVTIAGGPPTTNWTVQVFVNSKLSNQFLLV